LLIIKGKETKKFIQTIDRLFDFFNSRNPFNKGFKKPLYKEDIDNMKKTILPLVDYLLNITDVKRILISHTPRKTFVIGKLLYLLIFTFGNSNKSGK